MNKMYLEVQTAYANELNKVEFLESFLTFHNVDDFKPLLGFKNIQLNPVDDCFKFDGELYNLNFNEQEMEELKKNNVKNVLKNMCLEKLEEKLFEQNKNIIQDKIAQKLLIELDNMEIGEDEEETPEATVEDLKGNELKIYNTLQRLFKTVRIIKSETYCFFDVEFKCISLNHEQIKVLYSLLKNFNDLDFKILANYDYENDKDDKCHGIKFLWAFVEK